VYDGNAGEEVRLSMAQDAALQAELEAKHEAVTLKVAITQQRNDEGSGAGEREAKQEESAMARRGQRRRP